MARVLVVHRRYRLQGGEDTFFSEVLLKQLARVGHDVRPVVFEALFSRSSLRSRISDILELALMALGFESLRPSFLSLTREVARFKPDYVVFNNFIPTVSLAAPRMAKVSGAKTYAWVHNGRLSCANGLFFNGRGRCHECFTVGSRRAFRYKCLGSSFQSALYAWVYRHRRVARILGSSIDCFVGVSDYSARNVSDVLSVMNQSLPKTAVARGVVLESGEPTEPALKPGRFAPIDRPFYVFIGRVSFEKGADLFADLARKFPHKLFVLGGTGPLLEKINETKPDNLFVAGQVGPDEKAWLYANAEALIVSSRVPENSPMTIIESQTAATPVVYPRGGGAEEAVKFLGRSGCALDEFSGQKFSRTKKISLQQMQVDFETQLRELFS